jgi:hypothetical protein
MTSSREQPEIFAMFKTSICVIFAGLLAVLAGCQKADSAPCTQGQEDCACTADHGCDEGLSCEQDSKTCKPPTTLTLPSIDAAARSCELLLDDDTGAVQGANFEASVQGEFVRQAPHTAVTFFAAKDAAIPDGAVHIQVLGEGQFRITRAQCFDRDGKPIAGGGLKGDG